MRGAGAEDAGFLGKDRKRAGVSATHRPFAAHSLRKKNGADDEARTRYLDLGKVALYQMSYIRTVRVLYRGEMRSVNERALLFRKTVREREGGGRKRGREGAGKRAKKPSPLPARGKKQKKPPAGAGGKNKRGFWGKDLPKGEGRGAFHGGKEQPCFGEQPAFAAAL